MAETVLVTGAFGLVGAAEGDETRRTAAGDRHWKNESANRKAAQKLPTAWMSDGQTSPTPPHRSARLRGGADRDHSPGRGHPAGDIPRRHFRPQGQRRRHRGIGARRQSLPNPPRFVHASSGAVYGAPNPYRFPGLCRADTPLQPVTSTAPQAGSRTSGSVVDSDWVILRIGGVLTVDPAKGDYDGDVLFGSMLPTDGRVHVVDVRDVAPHSRRPPRQMSSAKRC